jgi:hypothetical protein
MLERTKGDKARFIRRIMKRFATWMRRFVSREIETLCP